MNIEVRSEILVFASDVLLKNATKEEFAKIVTSAILFDEVPFLEKELKNVGMIVKLRLP